VSYEEVGILSFQRHSSQCSSLLAQKTHMLKLVHGTYLCTKHNSVCSGRFKNSRCVCCQGRKKPYNSSCCTANKHHWWHKFSFQFQIVESLRGFSAFVHCLFSGPLLGAQAVRRSACSNKNPSTYVIRG